jgi:hypothetical protein
MMKKCKSITIAVLVWLTTANALSFPFQRVSSMNQIPENNSKPLTALLLKLGLKYNCYFTIEEAAADGESVNSMEAQWVQIRSAHLNLEQELDQLHRTVPNLTYEIDRTNPRIVHLIDSRLARVDKYGLEGVIKTIDFKGTVNDLVSEVAERGFRISPQNFIFTHEQPDFSTKVEVKGDNLKVREALSNFVLLEGRGSRVLWIARTKLAPGEVTYVFYPWPGKMAKQ